MSLKIKVMPELEEQELPRGLRDQYKRAVGAVEKKNLDYAILLLKEILKKEPGFTEGRVALRGVQRKKREGGGMFKKFIGAATSSPAIAKGKLALSKAQHDEALVQAEEILTDDPESQIGHHMLAEAANGLDLPRTALASAQELVKVSPENKTYCKLLASILEKIGDYEKAEKILKKLADEHMDDFELQQLYKDFSARATIHRGNYKKAASAGGSYRDALKDVGKTQSAEREERVQRTEVVLDQMIQEKETEFQENTQNLRLAVEIGKLNVQRKNFDRALEYFNYVATNGMAGDAAVDRLLSDTNLSRFDHMISLLNPEAANYKSERERLEEERREFELEDCRRRAEKFPTDMDIRYEYGVACFNAGKMDEAIPAFQRAQAGGRVKSKCLNYLGQCFAKQGMLDLAERSLLTAIEDKKGYDDLKKEMVYHLGCVYEKMGRPQNAFEQFQEVYEHDVGFRDVSGKIDAFYKQQREQGGQQVQQSSGPLGQGAVAGQPNLIGGGRYTLLRQLGRGGMGVVWLAKDEQLEEEVALKLLPEEMTADIAALNELKRETQKSRRLSHPNIVRTHDLVHMEGEAPFISMEFVEGSMLESMRLERESQVFQWPEIEKLILQLCDALVYAHKQKIVHRDIKPANLMVTTEGELKIADFGIAATMADSLSRSSMRNVISGTATYMSPQQLSGDVPRATDDIYAMGASIYELLTSRPPFFTGDLTYQIINKVPQPIMERLAEYGITNEVPDHICEMVMACISKESDRRPQDAQAISAWIRSRGQGELVVADNSATTV